MKIPDNMKKYKYRYIMIYSPTKLRNRIKKATELMRGKKFMFSLKKTKEKNYTDHDNTVNRGYKIALTIAAVIFILSAFAAFHAFTYPGQIERIAYENNI